MYIFLHNDFYMGIIVHIISSKVLYMNLLFIGDVVGKTGCEFLNQKLAKTKELYNIDITVVNGENSAQGNGIHNMSYRSIMSAGADVITTGNHAFRRHDNLHLFDDKFNLLRPVNFPNGCIGKGVQTFDCGRFSYCVINLMGTAFMDTLDNPFTVIDTVLEQVETPNIFVDFHAEATAEKKAMGYYLSKRVTAVLGTHTHVPTADETIIDEHTAYITDVGMTGAERSVLGVKIKPAVDRFRFHMPVQFTEAESASMMCGVVVSFDEKSGKAYNIQRVCIR
jgi:hypothetical protein